MRATQKLESLPGTHQQGALTAGTGSLIPAPIRSLIQQRFIESFLCPRRWSNSGACSTQDRQDFASEGDRKKQSHFRW